MNRAQLLLGKLAEESAEVTQIALKTQQFGFDEVCPDQCYTNAQRIHMELDDLFAIVEMLNDEYRFAYKKDRARIEAKKKRVWRYAEKSERLGTVRLHP